MTTLLHYLPHFLFFGLGLLALGALFGSDGRKKHAQPQRVRHQHYQWNDQDPRRG
ncbi:MAG: hypothetical protein JWN94_1942 [Betaproteobacteria bacterium]|nr:hypothetical protein [Betaproteobacteria bacterium]